ncbi:methionine biosynthesis PLP-dependent protein [Anaerobacillus isosaccharinicus]|uniref:Cystathionine gamma-synthase n=1 Tax=Anaerobacillus isosaccharinicus TaxID=1532552 RepID=A0A1S2KVY1_9BACI|nr:methionine biosynthesis PLP-dependent protein [Anaerobacillus isosaccharinicus]MBA5585826.1 methionine biosynthesis PLP-dependent protein [Anaerobacillus isosaccharinicus]QOY35878.1 methionine biosynthesis PLP-dependent protein [Anaerobacillus isosaccharinicus]
MAYKHLETNLVQLGNRSETKTGTINPPVYFSTAYRHEGIGQSTGYDYSRTGNPTRHILEEGIALLEGGDRGFACSSGMAAIQTVLSIFKQGDEIIVCQDLYGGTYRLFQQGWKHWGITFRYWDGEDYEQLESLVSDNTKAIFIETPTNPLMQEMSISRVSNVSKKHDLLLIVDNTFYTPYIQRPIEEGADIVIHSATKYLGGHNDVLAGLITAKGEEVCEKIGFFHNGIGATLSPFDSWLLIRGMKTLALRMAKHEENANAVAQFLREHPLVTDVLYPGRGGMLSFRIKDANWVNPLLQSLKLITFAESLGGVESLMTYPTTQTHADIPEDLREKYGVCKRLLRFSVGIENIEDLIEDLSQGLDGLEKGGDSIA